MLGHQCSFCGMANTEVEGLFVGPNGVAICNACIDECNRRMAEARSVEARRKDRKDRSA